MLGVGGRSIKICITVEEKPDFWCDRLLTRNQLEMQYGGDGTAPPCESARWSVTTVAGSVERFVEAAGLFIHLARCVVSHA